MHITNLNKIVKAKEVIAKIDKALERMDESHGEYASHDCGGIPSVADVGFNFHISLHKDGSGSPIDMSGCYVADLAIDAVANVLKEKRAKMVLYCESLGVSF